MRRLAVIVIAILLTAGGLAVAAWQGPRALDWSHLEPRLQEALGRAVVLDGPIRLDLLPRPVITVGDVSAIDIRVREARAVLDIGALLAGSLEIKALVFSGAELTFDRGLIRPLPPLSIRRIHIEDSRIIFGDAVVTIETALLTARGPQGPYRLKAHVALEGRGFRIAASAGKWRGRMPLTVSVEDGAVEATAVGAIEEDAAAGFVFSGRLDMRANTGTVWDGTLTSQVAFSPDEVAFTGIDAVVAGQRFTGTIRADWWNRLGIEAQLATHVLLFDEWQDLLLQLSGLASNANLRLALDADAVKFGERMVRKVEAAFRQDADGVWMERLIATLPGGTQVAMAGDGHESAVLSLKSRNLRALLLWLGIDPGTVEEARLRRLDVQAQLQLAGIGIAPEALLSRFENADFALEHIHGHLDGARLEGWVQRQGGWFDARLKAEGLLLDPYRPILQGRYLQPGRLDLDLSRTRLLGVPAARVRLAAELKQDKSIILSRLTLEDVGGFSGEASGMFSGAGTSFQVSGRTADLDRSAGLFGVALPVAARGLGAVEFGGRGEGLSDLLPLEFRARSDDWRLRLSGELAEQAHFRGHIALEGLLPLGLFQSDEPDSAVLTAAVSARSDRADFADVNIRSGAVRTQGSGFLSLQGERPAVAFTLATDRLDLPAPPQDVPVWRRRPFETGQFGAFDLDLNLRTKALRIGGELLQDLDLDLSLSPEAWLVKTARAGWRGGRLAFDGGYLAAEGYARLDLKLHDAVLPQHVSWGPSGARTDMILDLAAEGQSPYDLVSTLAGRARLEFAGGRLNGIDPAAAQSAFDEAPNAAALLRQLRQALVSGSGALISGHMEARIKDGIIQPAGVGFRLADGKVGVSGTIDLKRRLVDLAGQLAFPDRPNVPPFGFSVAGPLGSPDLLPEVEAIEALLLSEGVSGLVRPNAN